MSREKPSERRRTLNEKYLLGEPIGKGAYGKVHKGVDLQTGDIVAIKQVSLENIANEDLSSIMLEIDLLKALNHKNIVKYLGSFKTKSHLYIILEFVENGALSNSIKPTKFGAFPESLVALYAAQVLEGLAYLHTQGVIHRDIKAANILTTKEGTVKLADFGVATKLTEADTKAHSVVGSPYWMAPEVIEMSGVTQASDIWSVGCTVIELLTSVPPYHDLQHMPALFRIVNDDHPPLPPKISASAEDFLHQCFRKDPKLRSDAKQLLQHPWIRNAANRQDRIPNISRHMAVSSASHENGRDQEHGKDRDGRESDDGMGSGGLSSDDIGDISEAEEIHPNEHAGEHVTQSQRSMPSRSQRRAAGGLEESSSSSVRLSRKAMRKLSLRDGKTWPNASGNRQLKQKRATPKKTALDRAHGSVAQDNFQTRLQKSFTRAQGQPNFRREDMPLFDASLQVRNEKMAANARLLTRFVDTPEDEELEDLFLLDPELAAVVKEERPPEVAGIARGPSSVTKFLRKRLQERQDWLSRQSEEEEGDLFVALMNALSDEEGEYVVNERDDYAAEVLKQLDMLRPDKRGGVILSACHKLVEIFREHPEQSEHLITHRGVISIMELLDVENAQVVHAVLQLVNQVMQGNAEFQENLCLVGLVPTVMRFAAPDCLKPIRMEAAYFVRQMVHTSTLTLQMFIACRGLPVLVGFLERDYREFREMVHMAIDGIWKVFELQSPTPKNDFCRLFAKSGLLERVVVILAAINEERRVLLQEVPLVNQLNESDSDYVVSEPQHSSAILRPEFGQNSYGSEDSGSDRGSRGSYHNSQGGDDRKGSADKRGSEAVQLATEYVEKAANLLLFVSYADPVVKSQMCSLPLLHRLFQVLPVLEPAIQVKILKCIKQLSMEPTTLDQLQKAGAIQRLVPFLQHSSAPHVNERHNQVLASMYCLCRINRTRQEQAAIAGILPYLQRFVTRNSPLKQFALPLLFEMVHASRRTRAELWRNGCLQFYLACLHSEFAAEVLGQEFLQIAALDSIAVWLVSEPERVEDHLLHPETISQLVIFFKQVSSSSLAAVLESFMKMVTKSRRLNRAVAVGGLAAELSEKLNSPEANPLARLSMLKLIKAIYDANTRAKQLAAETNLPQQLRKLLESEREGELVLVKQMAQALLVSLGP